MTEETDDVVIESADKIIRILVSKVFPDPNQPRKHFNEASLNELAASIHRGRQQTPIVVQTNEDGYQIIAGERRWRACKLAGVRRIDAIVREYPDGKAIELAALVENMGREELQPLEIAHALKKRQDQYNLSVQQLADEIGKEHNYVQRHLELMRLHPSIQEMLEPGRSKADSISFSRASQISRFGHETQLKLIARIKGKKLGPREANFLIRSTALTDSSNGHRRKGPAEDLAALNNFVRRTGDDVKLFMQMKASVFEAMMHAIGNKKKKELISSFKTLIEELGMLVEEFNEMSAPR